MQIGIDMLGTTNLETFLTNEMLKRALGMTAINVGELVKVVTDELRNKLFNEVAYVWPRVGYPPLVTPFSQYVKNLAMMNVMAMEKGKERWGMILHLRW